MNILRISVISDHAADASDNAGLIETTYLVGLMKSLYAEVHTIEQPDKSVETTGKQLFVEAYWHFIKVDQANWNGFHDGLRLLNSAFEQSYEAVEVSVTLEGKTFPVPEYAAQKKVRTYRIGHHNQVYSEVCEYRDGEHYVTYHEVELNEDERLQLVCALHFEWLGADLPFGGGFYYANWWFAQGSEPVVDRVALSLIGCENISEVTVILDGSIGRIRHEEF
jgi:hypothetical protein